MYHTFQVKPYDINLFGTFCCHFFLWHRHKCSRLIPMCDIRCSQNHDNLLWEHTIVCCWLSWSNLAFFVNNNGTRNLQFVGSSWFLYRSWTFFERKARTAELKQAKMVQGKLLYTQLKGDGLFRVTVIECFSYHRQMKAVVINIKCF